MRSSTKIACAAGACLLLVYQPARAQQARPLQTSVGLELITGKIEGVAAQSQGTGSRAWGMQVNMGVTALRVLSLSADLGIADIADNNAFSEETTGGEMTSSVQAFLGTLAVGLRTPPLAIPEEPSATVAAGVNVGHTWMSAERGIVNCTDCTEQDLEITAGNFWEPGLYVAPGRRWGLNARYRVYMGESDLQNAILIGISGVL
ncbi:MAG TPA: hypothetical protein VHG08_10485 [Longimicrobium sp.]|nr:hypothetical protein [Longimicrobium sp.]